MTSLYLREKENTRILQRRGEQAYLDHKASLVEQHPGEHLFIAFTHDQPNFYADKNILEAKTQAQTSHPLQTLYYRRIDKS
ncbi:hypothetical protein A2642_02805 [Candidatus Nomurabacteria bacterium RIFCSPHIGHO2_01_FULL_39_10]|uniref:Uncharacterized protein n=1 Tax=Candidatus Nomurabacteria bacterium RIFCSPHIGHO2_01_FULL_39_10 TaxID=1801733 RepID=A0A1F6V5M9_9BACT|nr:MAG: hypothetical protein A2642_02805 [Candidatus Nomurabacteria bacterium RIFCSPHIGHO2_01_FULL_39_10]